MIYCQARFSFKGSFAIYSFFLPLNNDKYYWEINNEFIVSNVLAHSNDRYDASSSLINFQESYGKFSIIQVH